MKIHPINISVLLLVLSPQYGGARQPQTSNKTTMSTTEREIIDRFSRGEKNAWKIWRAAFIDTTILVNGHALNRPEDWLQEFQARAYDVKRTYGDMEPYIFVFANDADGRRKDMLGLIQLAESPEEARRIKSKAERWQKAVEDIIKKA